MASILIVDDEPSIRKTLKEILEYEKYKVDEAPEGLTALAKIKQQDYDAVLLDIKMPKMNGMEALERIQALKPDIPVIMISAHGQIEDAVTSVKMGAFDFIAKPLDLNRLLITMRNAFDKSTLINESRSLKTKIYRTTQEIIGDSESIQRVKREIDKVAPEEVRVLIMGENGTGKELVARSIHQKSQRADKPLVEVNCAAIPSELIESELFGHEKGSFTGAHKQKIGKFEQANGGTIFLDEIGDMSLSAQAKVLRALQENKITRVGGDKEVKVNVRVVAATNRNLMDMIAKKQFREDLYHRLAVIIIKVPPLNERRADIPLLVNHFIDLIGKEQGRKPKQFTEAALDILTNKVNWTGNIRELRNVVERLIILSGEEVTEDDVTRHVHKII